MRALLLSIDVDCSSKTCKCWTRLANISCGPGDAFPPHSSRLATTAQPLQLDLACRMRSLSLECGAVVRALERGQPIAAALRRLADAAASRDARTDEELAWAMTSEPAELIQRLAAWVSRPGAPDDEAEALAVEGCKPLAEALASLCREGLRQGPQLRKRLREAAASEASRIRARRLRRELAGTSAALRAGLGIDDAASDSSEEESDGRAGSPSHGSTCAALHSGGFSGLGSGHQLLSGGGEGDGHCESQFGGWLGDGPGVVLTGVGGGPGADCVGVGSERGVLHRAVASSHDGGGLLSGGGAVPAAGADASELPEVQEGAGPARAALGSRIDRADDASAAAAWRVAAAEASRALADIITSCPVQSKCSSPQPCTAAEMPSLDSGTAAASRERPPAAVSAAGRSIAPRPDRSAALAGMAGAALRLPFGHCLLAAAAPPLLTAIDAVAASAVALHRGAQGPCCCGSSCRCQPARAALELAQRLACICASEASTAAGGCDDEVGEPGDEPDAARRRATASWAARAPAFVQEATGAPTGSGAGAVSASGAASAKDMIRAILPRLAAAATAVAPAPAHESSTASSAGEAAAGVGIGPGHCPLCHESSLCDEAGLGILAAVRRWPTALDMAAARWPRRAAGALLSTLAGSAAALTTPQAPFEAFSAPPTPGVPAGAVALRLDSRGPVADVWHSRVLIALLALGQVVAEDGPVPNTRWLRRAARALAPLDPASLAALAMEVASSAPRRDPRSSGRYALAVEGAAVDCLWRVRRRVLACAADEDDEARDGGEGGGRQSKTAAPAPLRTMPETTGCNPTEGQELQSGERFGAEAGGGSSSDVGAGVDAPPVPEPLAVSGLQGAEQAVTEAGTVLFPLAYPVWWQLLRVLASRWPAHPSARQARETLSELALLLPPDTDEEGRLARWASGRERLHSSAPTSAGRRDGPCAGSGAAARRSTSSMASARVPAAPISRPQDIWLGVWTEAARRHASSAAMVAALAQALGAAVGAGLATPAAKAGAGPAGDPTAEAVRVLLTAAAASSASSPFATFAAATAVRSLADIAGDVATVGPIAAGRSRAAEVPSSKGGACPAVAGRAGTRQRPGSSDKLSTPAASAVVHTLQQPEAVWTVCRSIRGALLHSMAAVRHAISVSQRFPDPMWEGRATAASRAMTEAERAARTGSAAAAAAAGLLLLPTISSGSEAGGPMLGLAAVAADPTSGASAPELSDDVAAALLTSVDGLAAVLPVAARLRACSRVQLAAAAASGQGFDGQMQVLGQAATHALGALVWSAVSGRAGRRVLERAAQAGPGSASWAAAARTLSSVAEFVVPRASLAPLAEPPFRQLLNSVAAASQDASWSSLLLAAAPPPSVLLSPYSAEDQEADATPATDVAEPPMPTAWSSPAAPMWAAWVVEAEGAMALARLPWQWAASSAARAAFEAAKAAPPAAGSRRKGLRRRNGAKPRGAGSGGAASDAPAGNLAEDASGRDVASLFIASGWSIALKVTATDASLADEWAGTAARSWAQRLCCDCRRQQTAALALTRPSPGTVGDLVEETAPEVRRAALRLVAVTRRAVECGDDPSAHAAATAEARWALFRPPPVFLLPRFCCLPTCRRQGRRGNLARGSFVEQTAQAQCPAPCRSASSPQRLLAVLLVILAGLLAAAFIVGDKPVPAAAT